MCPSRTLETAEEPALNRVNWYFLSHAQNFVFDVRKRGTSCPKWGRGNLDNAQKKTFFFREVFPNTSILLVSLPSQCIGRGISIYVFEMLSLYFSMVKHLILRCFLWNQFFFRGMKSNFSAVCHRPAVGKYCKSAQFVPDFSSYPFSFSR